MPVSIGRVPRRRLIVHNRHKILAPTIFEIGAKARGRVARRRNVLLAVLHGLDGACVPVRVRRAAVVVHLIDEVADQ